MSKYGEWRDALEAIDKEINEEAKARVAKGESFKEADGEARADVIDRHQQHFRDMLREIEQRIATIQTEPEDRADRVSDIKRHEELRDRIQEHLRGVG